MPRVSVDDFARTADVSQMRLSPDGQYESFLHENDGHPAVCTRRVGSTNATVFDLGENSVYGHFVPRSVIGYQWISDDRLIVQTGVWNYGYGVFAVNRDASRFRGISGLETLPYTRGMLVNVNLESLLWATRCIHAFDDRNRSILMLDEHTYSGGSRLYPDVVRVNTLTGTADTVVKNPGNVVGWAVDHNGQVRMGLVDEGSLRFRAIVRDNDRAPWRARRLPPGIREAELCGFDPDNRHVYIGALSPRGRLALYRLDLAPGGKAQLVASDPDYDLLPPKFVPSPAIDGDPLMTPIFSPQHTLLGVRFLRSGPRVHWFDPKFAGYQQAIDHTMPHTVNLCVGISRDEKRVLYLCFSDRDPGTYCVLDAAAKSIRPVGRRMPWINPAVMAPMYPISYRARDGVTIHGYLTVPVGCKPAHLPLVVLPHGGPWVRDVWGFDRLVQLLANRGYAVLQMNYRGSTGYGHKFYELGRRQVGGAIQDDIEDGTRWAIKAGLADPHRIAILGISYGGFSALYALGHNPDLYRCGVSIAGVTDWMRIFRSLKDDEYKFSREYWQENIGDPDRDAPKLKAASPVDFAAKITAPVLLIQGTADRTVPPSQAHAMVAALEAAGHRPQSLFLSGDGHGLTSAKARRDGFRAIETFLAVNLGPGAVPAGGQN